MAAPPYTILLIATRPYNLVFLWNFPSGAAQWGIGRGVPGLGYDPLLNMAVYQYCLMRQAIPKLELPHFASAGNPLSIICQEA